MIARWCTICNMAYDYNQNLQDWKDSKDIRNPERIKGENSMMMKLLVDNYLEDQSIAPGFVSVENAKENKRVQEKLYDQRMYGGSYGAPVKKN